MTMNERLTQAREAKGLRKSAFAKLIGVSAPTVTDWESGKIKRIEGANLINAAAVLGVSADWLLTGKNQPTNKFSIQQVKADYGLLSADEVEAETGKIEYWNVRGSCGGGFLNYDQMPKGHLIKEATFFKKYGVRPENTFAIYADGDSMADFIVDGDIVIFDKSKTQPISGQIFAIEHPDGLRIKVIRRSIDGSWTLESKNQDKRSFPDEVIPAGHAELLKIHGQFVYRQGG